MKKVKKSNPIIGAFFTIDPEKCDNKLKKIYEKNVTKKIRQFCFENPFRSISVEFAVIQAFTAPREIKWGQMVIFLKHCIVSRKQG